MRLHHIWFVLWEPDHSPSSEFSMTPTGHDRPMLVEAPTPINDLRHLQKKRSLVHFKQVFLVLKFAV
jgi:hypothetical protein